MLGRKHLQVVSNKTRQETLQNEEQEEQYPGLSVPIFTEEFLTYSKGTVLPNFFRENILNAQY